MVTEGRAQYATGQCSMLRACVTLLEHIGYVEKAKKLERALDICTYEERKVSDYRQGIQVLQAPNSHSM